MTSENMTQTQFLLTLKQHLESHRVANIDDILSDYREHFIHGKEKGKSEAQICEDLGNPVTIAKAYEAESLIREVKDTKHPLQSTVIFKVLLRLLVLAPFNFFMLLIPGIIIAAMLFAGWAAAFGFGVSALVTFTVAAKASLFALNFWAGLAAVFASLGLLGLTVIAAMIVFLISKFVLMSLVSYLQWNLKFILEK